MVDMICGSGAHSGSCLIFQQHPYIIHLLVCAQVAVQLDQFRPTAARFSGAACTVVTVPLLNAGLLPGLGTLPIDCLLATCLKCFNKCGQWPGMLWLPVSIL
jgi:hypothetical protein